MAADSDGPKVANDIYGYEEGDCASVATGDVSCIGPWFDDTVTCSGGDEPSSTSLGVDTDGVWAVAICASVAVFSVRLVGHVSRTGDWGPDVVAVEVDVVTHVAKCWCEYLRLFIRGTCLLIRVWLYVMVNLLLIVVRGFILGMSRVVGTLTCWYFRGIVMLVMGVRLLLMLWSYNRFGRLST